MQESNHQIAERLLRQRGYDNPADMILSVQEFISQYSETPLQAIGRLVQENQLVCIGEIHNYEGRYMHSELIKMATIHGANVLFVEVYENEQSGIDYFLQTGDFSRISAFANASNTNLLPFERPSLQMLETARVSGMKIIAVDILSNSISRDKHMAEAILNHFAEYPRDRGVFVVGQLHLQHRPLVFQFKTVSTLLKESFKGSVATIGRAYIDINQEFEGLLSIWALMANVSQPLIAPTKNSPFVNLPNYAKDNLLLGNDFDYLFFYPYPMDENAEVAEQNKVLQEQQNFLAIASGALHISPFAAAELLCVKNLMERIDRLDPLVKQGNQAARIEYERLHAEMLEHSQRYAKMTGNA